MMEWIDVNERLPDCESVVLCYGFTGENDNDGYEKDYDLGQLNLFHETIFMFGFDSGHVTHWMPLPEPPKEKD